MSAKTDAQKNPLTLILEDAQQRIEQHETDLFSEYGVPLYTELPGEKAVWPSDPEAMSPEEMAVLIQTQGEIKVNQWLAQHYSAKAEAASFGL